MRNIFAQIAHFRNSAGPIKDRRYPREGARNSFRDFMNEYQEVLQGEDEVYFDSFEEEEEKEGM